MKVTEEMVTEAMNTYLHISPDGVNTNALRAVLEQALAAQPAYGVGGDARLEELAYVPGAWRCPKCNLRLFAQTLHVQDGGMSANNQPQPCANGCGPMWRVTEREDRQDAQRFAIEQGDKLNALLSTRPAESVAQGDRMASVVRKLAPLAKHADDCLWASPLPTGEGSWHCTCGLDSIVLDGELIPGIATTPTPATGSGGECKARFYLASFRESGSRGGEVLWWAPNNAGYTPDLEQAGIYTALTPGYHDSERTVPVPVSLIRELRVRRTVDPGDTLNGMFWTAEKLRAAIAAHPAPAGGDAGDRLEACKPYLKDGETPAECLARNQADVASMLGRMSAWTHLTQEELFAGMKELSRRIEACGGSPELTRAVMLSSDVGAAIGNKWNPADAFAALRVRSAIALTAKPGAEG